MGLCDDCDEELRAEIPQPATGRLLAPGHLPEEIPAQYVPAESGWTDTSPLAILRARAIEAFPRFVQRANAILDPPQVTDR